MMDRSLSRFLVPMLLNPRKYQDDPNWDEYQTAIAAARQAANEIEGIWLEGDAAQ
jgi:hypothetical protein